MNINRNMIFKNIGFCLRGIIPLITLLTPQAATGIDETMPVPDSIPAEVIADWESQDGTAGHSTKAEYYKDIDDIAKTLASGYAMQLTNDSTKASYYKACHLRRASRIKPYSGKLQRILYARHYDLGGSGAGFLELNDTAAMPEGYSPGGALLLLNFQNCYPKPTTLLSDTNGCIKDPCVSFSGNKAVFAWDKDGTGFHIYEIVIGVPDSIRQLTNDTLDRAVSDFEPCYLPNGDILFNSTRCMGMIPSNGRASTNLYMINKDGKYLRRIGYDLANTFYPTIMSDAALLYSRWEYNDRNNASCFGLFQMNIDGTHQVEFFGNQLSWPVSIYQGREIPDASKKVIAIIGGKVGPYNGDLVIIDPLVDRNAAAAVKLIAPKRSNPINPDPAKGIPDSARHFQTPYPLDENWFLISYRQNVTSDKFKIYMMHVSGKRELLAWDSRQSVSQQQPLSPRSFQIPAYLIDYRTPMATIKLLNPYYGIAMDTTVKQGSIKKIRVIALDYRVAPAVGKTGSEDLYALTPVARWKGSWNAKRIVGDGILKSDGSANFFVPSRTPLCFQLIDSNGCLIQTMRSWTTLQPGEKFECYGCHENKNESPQPIRPLALKTIPLDSFYGSANVYLSYSKHIQPILTAKCTPCHIDGDSGGINLKDEKIWTGDLTDPFNKNAERYWCKSYLTLTDSAKNLVSYIDAFSPAEGLRPKTVGSGKSKLITRLREGMHGATLSDTDMVKLCAWIDLGIPHSGTYTDDMKEEHATIYNARLKIRQDLAAIEDANIASFVNDSQYQWYTSVRENPNNRFSGANRAMLKVWFSSLAHRLSVRIPSEGTLSLIDLRGRRIMTANVSGDEFKCRPERSFFLRAPAGLYIVKFRGRNGSVERTVPIF
jgi:hypothetical protein